MPIRNASSSRVQTASRCGFSLIDVTVSLLILGVLAGVSVPRMQKSIAFYRADAAAERVAADLVYVAKYARTRGASETINFDRPTSRYSCSTIPDTGSSAGIYTVDLSEHPYAGSIESVSFAGATSVTFDGYGFPDAGGLIVVKSGNEQRKIRLDQATGNVAIESN